MPDDPALIGHRTVTQDAVATFAGLTGDYARIHLDHRLGEASPYGSGFAHGLLSASWALGALTLQAPERVGAGELGACVSGFRVRFDDVVRFDDTLALEYRDATLDTEDPGWDQRHTEFTFRNQDGRGVTSGAVALHVRRPDAPPGALPSAEAEQPLWEGGRYEWPPGVTTWAAEDLLESGPRGASPVRTLTEADVVGFANFTGELNPLYLNAVFAERALFGQRIVPPMLCFCLGFAVWLREFLRLPMGGSSSSAGHLGDRWQFVAPVHIGDTLEVRYKPLSLRRTRSQPSLGVLTFGLQVVNQREAVVQQGEVDMMLAMRATE
jgi:acyl dehydratase